MRERRDLSEGALRVMYTKSLMGKAEKFPDLTAHLIFRVNNLYLQVDDDEELEEDGQTELYDSTLDENNLMTIEDELHLTGLLEVARSTQIIELNCEVIVAVAIEKPEVRARFSSIPLVSKVSDFLHSDSETFFPQEDAEVNESTDPKEGSDDEENAWQRGFSMMLKSTQNDGMENTRSNAIARRKETIAKRRETVKKRHSTKIKKETDPIMEEEEAKIDLDEQLLDSPTPAEVDPTVKATFYVFVEDEEKTPAKMTIHGNEKGGGFRVTDFDGNEVFSMDWNETCGVNLQKTAQELCFDENSRPSLKFQNRDSLEEFEKILMENKTQKDKNLHNEELFQQFEKIVPR